MKSTPSANSQESKTVADEMGHRQFKGREPVGCELALIEEIGVLREQVFSRDVRIRDLIRDETTMRIKYVACARIVTALADWSEVGNMPSSGSLMPDSETETFGDAIRAAAIKLEASNLGAEQDATKIALSDCQLANETAQAALERLQLKCATMRVALESIAQFDAGRNDFKTAYKLRRDAAIKALAETK